MLVEGLIFTTFSLDVHLKMEYLSIHFIPYYLQNAVSEFSLSVPQETYSLKVVFLYLGTMGVT
jgi:hypothetical protein